MIHFPTLIPLLPRIKAYPVLDTESGANFWRSETQRAQVHYPFAQSVVERSRRAGGLVLCQIHHVAFDPWIVGTRPDYVIQVQEDVLREEDGPMLKYGLKSLHNSELLVPARIEDGQLKTTLG